MKWVKDGPRSWRLIDGEIAVATVFGNSGVHDNWRLWAWIAGRGHLWLGEGLEYGLRAAKRAAMDALKAARTTR